MSDIPPSAFGREYGYSEADWQRCLPGAVHGHGWHCPGPGRAQVNLAEGLLHLRWTVLAARRIALFAFPRLQVEFRFEDVPPQARAAFMRRFDLFMHRGGG